MSSLIWLGSFFATWWFFNHALVEANTIYLNRHKGLFKSRKSDRLGPLMAHQLLSSIFGFSGLTQLYDSVLLIDLRMFSRREYLLRLALTPLSWIVPLLLLLLILQINGWGLIGLIGLFVLVQSRVVRGRHFEVIYFALYFALFLVFFEGLLRQQSLLLNLETDISFVFILADSNPITWLGCFFVSIILSLGLRLRNWSLIWGLFLVMSQASPVISALAWILGERVADGLLFWYRTRNFKFMKMELISFSWIWGLAWLASFCTLVILSREITTLESEFNLDGYFRLVEMICLLLLCHGIVTSILLAWGHWASLKKSEFEAAPFVGALKLLDQGQIGTGFLRFYAGEVDRKIGRLEKQRTEFNSEEWSAVPRPFQKQWEAELHNLKEFSSGAKSVLSSRSPFSWVIHF